MSSSPPLKLVYRFYLIQPIVVPRLRILFDNIHCCKPGYLNVRVRLIHHRSLLRSTDSCLADWISCRIVSPSAAAGRLRWPGSWPRPRRPTPLPLPSADAPAPPASDGRHPCHSHRSLRLKPGVSPFRFQARAEPARDKPGHGVAVATPGDVTRGT